MCQVCNKSISIPKLVSLPDSKREEILLCDSHNLELSTKRKQYLDSKKERYLKSRVSLLEKASIYYQNNRESKLEYAKEYAENNKEKIKTYKAQWVQDNKEHHNMKSQEWAKANPKKRKEIVDKCRKAHPEYNTTIKNNRRALEANVEGTHTSKEWKELCEKYNNKCLCCKSQTKLTRDHIVPLSKGGTNYISNIQPLCLSCNSSKKQKIIDYRVDYFAV